MMAWQATPYIGKLICKRGMKPQIETDEVSAVFDRDLKFDISDLKVFRRT